MVLTPAEINLHLKSIEEMFPAKTVSFFLNRKLNKQAEEFILEMASALPHKSPITLNIHNHLHEISKAEELTSAIHQHFAFCKLKSGKQLKRTLELGWKSLLISMIFLGVLISLVTFTDKRLPQGGLIITFREVIVILGWVALWRPADLLLYEWRPFKQEVKLYGRLAQCKVQIRS